VDRSRKNAAVPLRAGVPKYLLALTCCSMDDIRIGPEEITPTLVGEVLTLQRAAYVTEAQLYADAFLPPLLQTFEEIQEEMHTGPSLMARVGERLIGSVRARQDGRLLRIGKLVVAPDLQGRGIGTRLLAGIEELAPEQTSHFLLFTGTLSTANLRLYNRAGYVETCSEQLPEGAVVVRLEKPVRSGNDG
jgi:GNAT superfamily N-acetyltransferase